MSEPERLAALLAQEHAMLRGPAHGPEGRAWRNCEVCEQLRGGPVPDPDLPLDPNTERLADLFMDLRLDGPAADGWTYQQTARHYAHLIAAGVSVPAEPEAPDLDALDLPWERVTIGHANVFQIADSIARSLAVPLPDGIPPHTDATWVYNASGKVVCFVGNGPRQTENGDLIVNAANRLASQHVPAPEPFYAGVPVSELQEPMPDMSEPELAEARKPEYLDSDRLARALGMFVRPPVGFKGYGDLAEAVIRVYGERSADQ